MRFQISVGDSFSTGCQNIIVSDVQPHTGLWGCRIANGYRQGTPNGVRFLDNTKFFYLFLPEPNG